VSLLRRENEFLRILEESGGIVHLGSKEFLDAHMALLDALASAGEPTSGLPGLKVDKRTIENTFESLENRGKVRVLKTAIFTVTGAQRPARVVYFPTVAQSQLDIFLAELGKSPHGTPYSVTGSVAASIPPVDMKTKRPAQPLRLLQSERGVDNIGRWARSSDTADQLFQSDDQTIHDVLLTERTTLAQLYGFIPGKMVRARQLHLATLDTFGPCHDPPIPSLAAKRVVEFSQYFRNFPVGVYCSIVSTLVQSDELSQILSTEEGRRTLVKDLPQSLQTLLQIGRPRSRERLIDLFEILHHLDLVTPLQPSDSPNPRVRCESNGEGSFSFDTFEGDLFSTSYRTAPDFWLFHDDAALHLWALSTASPPFWKTVSVSNRLDASNYWNELQSACESKAFAQTVTRNSPSCPIVPDYSFARAIVRDASWNRMYDLSWHQRQYLKRFNTRWRDDVFLQDQEDGPTLEKVSWTISAPLSVVKDFLQKEQTSQLRELDKARLRTPGNEGDEEHTEKLAQEKELLAKKVANSKARKEREWGAILNAVHAGELDGAAVTRVMRVRKRYLQSGVASDRSRWEDEVRDAIRGLGGHPEAVLPSAQRVAPTRPLQGLPSVPVAIPPLEATGSTLCHAGLPPIVANQPRKSIEQLIAEQGPAREEARKSKRKQKKKSEEGTGAFFPFGCSR
jgi:oxalate---CoA ligase